LPFTSNFLPPTSLPAIALIFACVQEHPSRVAAGLLKGMTIGQLLKRSPEQLLGECAARFDRFPLLLKFLDVKTKLPVQVHPSDAHRDLIPPGDSGKIEAWVVLAVRGGRGAAGAKV
jgi:mannose-6-phosphate isomerase